MKKYKLLIFDLGGTIVKPVMLSKDINMAFLKDCVKEPLTGKQIDQIEIFFNSLRDEIHRNHDRQFEISIKNLLVTTFNRFNLAPCKKIEEIEKMVIFGNTEFYRPPDSTILFDYLMRGTVNTCIVSNSEVSSGLLFEIINGLYPSVDFSRIYSSADLMFRKPATEMVKKALEDFHFSPQECCIIGNGEEDMAVANSLDMDCFLVFYKKISGALKYKSIQNLNELLQYIY